MLRCWDRTVFLQHGKDEATVEPDNNKPAQSVYDGQFQTFVVIVIQQLIIPGSQFEWMWSCGPHLPAYWLLASFTLGIWVVAP